MSAAIIPTSTLGCPPISNPSLHRSSRRGTYQAPRTYRAWTARKSSPRGGHCLFRPPSNTAGNIVDRSLSIKPLQARINGKGLRFNATAISTVVPPAYSISESRFSSPDVQRLAGRLEVQPAPEHEACQHMLPEKGLDFCENRPIAVRAACRRGCLFCGSRAVSPKVRPPSP
jgi:hypothetical protein